MLCCVVISDFCRMLFAMTHFLNGQIFAIITEINAPRISYCFVLYKFMKCGRSDVSLCRCEKGRQGIVIYWNHNPLRNESMVVVGASLSVQVSSAILDTPT